MGSKQYTHTAAFLFTLLFAISFLNDQLFSNKQGSSNLSSQKANLSSRLPASTNLNWEAELIKKYTSGFRDKKNLVVGKRPDTFEKFAFGTLNGSYAINLLGGKIASLEFNKDQNTDEPQIIKDTYSFLIKNKNILAVEFDSVAKVSERYDGKSIYEEYGLFSASLIRVATVEIKSDQDHHFLSLKIARDGSFASN
ncbi:MAG: hypothetical protein SGJ18_12790 [Pseudomonadota bacterium]|nr:hypothetical protein [Pseudomonadota bacterium]